MSAPLLPRVVLVRRLSEYELLIEQHGTREQARFSLERQGIAIAEVQARDTKIRDSLKTVRAAIPRSWRIAELLRYDLSRFVFEQHDIIVVVGQDGLVANVAKYLNGQPVIGINPDPSAYEGILTPHEPQAAASLMKKCNEERVNLQSRTMAEAILDDGQRLLALNEIFIGHASHQSARYSLVYDEKQERQSSSGVIVSTGTGGTGWARSINLERENVLQLPEPQDKKLAFFVREAFPGSGFSTDTSYGLLGNDLRLEIVSEMNQGGVIFGDGIEEDRIDFQWGSRAKIGIAREHLQLVV